jgi:hypothetical protein
MLSQQVKTFVDDVVLLYMLPVADPIFSRAWANVYQVHTNTSIANISKVDNLSCFKIKLTIFGWNNVTFVLSIKARFTSVKKNINHLVVYIRASPIVFLNLTL